MTMVKLSNPQKITNKEFTHFRPRIFCTYLRYKYSYDYFALKIEIGSGIYHLLYFKQHNMFN